MSTLTVFELPEFDTGQYDGCELHMSEGDAVLTIHVAGTDGCQIHFKRVRWHRFTAIYACPADWISGCYFTLAEVTDSAESREHLRADRATMKPYKELHHFRIVLDETGCHEFLAESANAL